MSEVPLYHHGEHSLAILILFTATQVVAWYLVSFLPPFLGASLIK